MAEKKQKLHVRAAECLVVTADSALEERFVYGVRAGEDAVLSEVLSKESIAFAHACDFSGKPGQFLNVQGKNGVPVCFIGLEPAGQRHPYQFGQLARDLPSGDWQAKMPDDIERDDVLLGFCLGAYRYALKAKDKPGQKTRLVVTKEESKGQAVETARSVWLARDLINMPANLLGPKQLAQAAYDVLTSLGAEVDVIKGKELRKNYPLVAHVGEGSERRPRVVVARWQGSGASKKSPLLSLVGKGVCFDSGGYDLKPSSGMLRMKKDMGGAASVLALARLIMTQDLPIRLEVRLGCVENSVSGRAMRPLDVVKSRAGLTVEIGNTDAEGRLVLADLLTEAGEHQPDLLLNMATLTGAARVALGPDLPALFTNSDKAAQALLEAGQQQADPLWRLPLWQGYAGWINSSVADLSNITYKPHAGAVTAALFLERFVTPDQKWVHIDTYAWNDSARPGRPEGGDSPAIRAVFAACDVLLNITKKTES